MRIKYVTIERFRRFAAPTSVRLDGSVIAVVGPNEAGKSTFLDALAALDDENGLGPENRTRDLMDGTPTVTASFELEKVDQEALADIRQGSRVQTCALIASTSGLRLTLDPVPSPDLTPRHSFISTAEMIGKNAILQKAANNRKLQYSPRVLRQLTEHLRSEKNYLGKDFFENVKGFLDTAQNAINNVDANPSAAEELESFMERLRTVRDHEANPPVKQCREILMERVPRFLKFDAPERDLKATYDLSAIGDSPPSPLRNLAALADLDLHLLQSHVQADRRAQVHHLCERASERLAAVFSEAWVHEDVVPVVAVNETRLDIFVRTPGGNDLSRFDERSDGFRWFVALLAFVSGQPARPSIPVLLIDEAETHLSYDAQANLSATLVEQKVAQLVVYSTHSAGCLPPDLGTGIRTVVPEDTGERSTINNGFWHEGPGFTPLMLAMGASALAFTPARRVIVGEGASESILLPSLLREATGTRPTFQVAPGLSNVRAEAMRDVMSMAGEVGYLVDGDEGGNNLRDRLVEMGVPKSRIVSYRTVGRSALSLEDLVHPKTLVYAVEEELRRWQGVDVKLDDGALPSTSRMKWISDWCAEQGLKPLSKPTLSQRIVELRGDRPLIDPKRRRLVRRLAERLESVLKEPLV